MRALIVALVLAGSAFAQDSVDDLQTQLANRWYDVIKSESTPKFLKEKADEEAVFSGVPPAAEILKRYLDSDGKAVNGKISELLKNNKDYYGLVHQMKPKYLVEFLQTKELKPRSGRFGDNSEGDSLPAVYLELISNKKIKTFEWADAELTFDYSVLDRTDYLMNPYWDYGKFTLYSAAPAVSRGRVQFFIKEYLLEPIEVDGKPEYKNNEVVFSNSMWIDELIRVKVPLDQRDALIAELRAKNIPLPKRFRDWRELIIGQKK